MKCLYGSIVRDSFFDNGRYHVTIMLEIRLKRVLLLCTPRTTPTLRGHPLKNLSHTVWPAWTVNPAVKGFHFVYVGLQNTHAPAEIASCRLHMAAVCNDVAELFSVACGLSKRR
jgi:hypothetical protein